MKRYSFLLTETPAYIKKIARNPGEYFRDSFRGKHKPHINSYVDKYLAGKNKYVSDGRRAKGYIQRDLENISDRNLFRTYKKRGISFRDPDHVTFQHGMPFQKLSNGVVTSSIDIPSDYIPTDIKINARDAVKKLHNQGIISSKGKLANVLR